MHNCINESTPTSATQKTTKTIKTIQEALARPD
jgi:hypothetical protein